MQSEFACHLGQGGKFFCRMCDVKGFDSTSGEWQFNQLDQSQILTMSQIHQDLSNLSKESQPLDLWAVPVVSLPMRTLNQWLVGEESDKKQCKRLLTVCLDSSKWDISAAVCLYEH
jgi:hypothetical protein